MERTCVELTAPFLEAYEQMVGIHVDVRPMAHTRIGQSVTATVALLEVKDKKLRYAVAAVNDEGEKSAKVFTAGRSSIREISAPADVPPRSGRQAQCRRT